MKVWVAVQGCYSSQWVAGVYATVEAAIAAHPVTKVFPPDWKSHFGSAERPGGWMPDDKGEPDGAWGNGLDWGEAVSLEPYDLEGLTESAVRRFLEEMLAPPDAKEQR